MSAIPVGLTSNLYGEKISSNSATCVASPSNINIHHGHFTLIDTYFNNTWYQVLPVVPLFLWQ